MVKYTKVVFISITTIILLCFSNVHAFQISQEIEENISIIDSSNINEFDDEVSQKDISNKKNAKRKVKSSNFVDNEEYISDNIIITFQNRSFLEKAHIDEEIVGEYESLNSIVIKIPQDSNIEELVDKYKKNVGVISVEQEYLAVPSFIPEDEYYSNYQYNLTSINMEDAWNITKGSSDVVIAVIDTGVGPQEDLNGKLINGASILNGEINVDSYPGEFSYDGGANDAGYSSTNPVFPHGTSVSAIISSEINTIGIAGIAPNIKIMPIKVFEDAQGLCSFVDVALAVEWATEHGANIINLSLGGAYAPDVLEEKIDYAYDEDIIIVAATGNDGLENINYPAFYDNVIAVGSSNASEQISSFSNYGGELDIVAPGENIFLPYIGNRINSQGFLAQSGTSFSSPTVAAIAGLVKSKYPSLSNFQIQQILYTSAEDITQIAGWDVDSGFGRVDAFAALNLASDTSIWDNNDTMATAKTIDNNEKITGNLYPARDGDAYKINITKSGNIKISVESPSENDLVLLLTDSNGDLVEYTDDFDSGSSEFMDVYIDNEGTYYLWVFDYYGDYSQSIYNLVMNPVNAGEISRDSGNNRWETASLISQDGWVQSDNIVLAYGMNFPDALAGAPLAKALNAPLLLTDKETIPISTMNEIQRLNAQNIYLLGGELVISSEIENTLISMGYTVKRVYGNNRCATAIKIGEELRGIHASDTAVLAYGFNYPDALSISSIAAEKGWPILFTDSNTLQNDTKKALDSWNISNVIIVGGSLAIDPQIESQLEQMGIAVERIAGRNRLDTNIKILQRFKSTTDGVLIATGFNFPDALSGGALGAKFKYPVVLVKKDDATDAVLNYLASSGVDRSIILGGTQAVQNNVKDQIAGEIQ